MCLSSKIPSGVKTLQILGTPKERGNFCPQLQIIAVGRGGFSVGQTTSDNLCLEPNKILLNLNPPCAVILWPSFLFSLAVISHSNSGL